MHIRCTVKNRSTDESTSWRPTGTNFRIGRDKNCQLRISGDGVDSVSNEHAEIELSPEGAILRDLGSTNGTFLNSRRINSPIKLQVGDTVELGREGPSIQVEEIEVKDDSRGSKSSGGSAPPPHASSAQALRTARPSVIGASMPYGGNGLSTAGSQPPVSRPGELVPAPVSLLGKSDADVIDAPRKTHQMMEAVQSGQRKLWVGVAVAASVLIFVMGGIAIYLLNVESSGEEIYRKTLPASVWVVTESGLGSGSLVDYENRFVVTNYHVVEELPQVKVYFPSLINPGVPLTYQGDYIKHEQAIPAKVIERDSTTDLAILQLDWLPESARALKLCSTSAKPGESVYSIGNPGAAEGDLWVFTAGAVRQVTHKTYPIGDPKKGRAQNVDAWVVQTQSPINPGDSGGPVVNSWGELVAVNSSAKMGEARLMTQAIDIRHVRKILYNAGSPQP